ncbi:MAG TPA: phBC6A51 family helix-turn-helix protein [Sphingobacteriaceae bacterium]
MPNDKRRKQYWATRNALSKDEKKVIDYYELQWHLNHRVPTTEEVSNYTKLSHIEINTALARKPVAKALDDRGINWRQHSQFELTSEQIACATLVMNFADERKLNEKLDSLGILPATYFAWLKDPGFKNYVDSLADSNLKNIRPAAVGEFTRLVHKGDWQAIKYYFEVTGEFGSSDGVNAENLVKLLIEIIQKHVKDPEVMLAISQDILNVVGVRTIEPHRPAAITAEVVEHDPELEKAQKMLGFG